MVGRGQDRAIRREEKPWRSAAMALQISRIQLSGRCHHMAKVRVSLVEKYKMQSDDYQWRGNAAVAVYTEKAAVALRIGRPHLYQLK